MQEGYDSLTKKTLSFLRAAVATWDAEYIVKVIAQSNCAAGTCSQQTKFLFSNISQGVLHVSVGLQVDDDVYLRTQHLMLAMKQWKAMQAGRAGHDC